MRIAIFIDVNLNRNGVGSYFNDLAKFYRSQNHDVDIYNAENNSKIISSIKFPGDRTQNIPIPNYFNLRKSIIDKKPDIIFLSFYGLFCMIGKKMARKLKIPYIYVVNNDVQKFINHYYTGIRNYSLRNMSNHVEKNLINDAKNVIIVNPELKHIPNRYNPKSITPVGTLIDSIFIDTKQPEPVTQINKILYYGRLAIEKNINLIIQAAEKFPHIKFNIAGDGPLKDGVIKASTTLENLSYLGWIERMNLIPLIEKNDMVVMPSSFETFGTVALESLSRGRIVVVDYNHGIRQFDILNKCLFNMADFKSLDETIKIISKLSEEKISDISIQSFKAVQEYDSKTKLAWINLLTDLN